MAAKPAVGEKAPDFTLPDQDGVPRTLSDHRGRWVLLFFYPRDQTPGCQRQVCAFRDVMQRFEWVDVVVYGVSADDVASHKAFAEAERLPYKLLADPSREVIERYGAMSRIPLLNVAQRVTFVIDPEGVVRHVHESALDPAGHAEAAWRAVAAGRGS
ncbi:MAG TPA: peroxiredoxin [Candidatus Thermoplasmatota archaeon]|nr:peroxiredoxin [Candidatus Thermoplasmatota archaeon]